jgi:RNA 2',3'-cyclic 3'-phosphodiesterase
MRLFIAVAADAEVRSAAAERVASLRGRLEGWRWVEPRDMHVTLRFLGEREEAGLAQAKESMLRAASAVRPFEIVYGALGAFDSREDARVAWVGLSAGLEPMERLAELLGRDEPRPYTPHLTLGRRRASADAADAGAFLEAQPPLNLRRPVRAISLYAGLPSPVGRAYEVLFEAGLSA